MHIVTRTLCAAGFTLLTQGAFAACTAATVKAMLPESVAATGADTWHSGEERVVLR